MSGFQPYPYTVRGPSGGGGVPQPGAVAPQEPVKTSSVVAHSREVDLREIAGDVDPPVANTTYQRDYLMLVPADCSFQRLRLSAGRNATGLSMRFQLIQLDGAGVLHEMIPSTEVRVLGLEPTDYESVTEILPDVPVMLRVFARYQLVRLFATIEALYTSVPE